MFDPAFGRIDLLAQLGGVGLAKIVADRSPADIKPEPGALATEAGQVLAAGLGEVVGGGLDGAEAGLGRKRHEGVQRHGRVRFSPQVHVAVEAVGREAQLDQRLIGTPNWLDCRNVGGGAKAGAGGDGGAKKVASLWIHGLLSSRRIDVTGRFHSVWRSMK